MCWPVCPLITPAPRGPLLRRCVITTIIAHTAPCASLVPTRELPADGYIAGLTGTRPSLLCIPDFATVPPPPYAGELPGDICPTLLTPEDPAFAEKTPARRSQFPANCLLAGKPHDAAAIPLCYGPVACSPPWAVPSYDGEDFILGASTEVVTQSRCPIRYAAVRLLPRPVLPRLA